MFWYCICLQGCTTGVWYKVHFYSLHINNLDATCQNVLDFFHFYADDTDMRLCVKAIEFLLNVFTVVQMTRLKLKLILNAETKCILLPLYSL